MRHQSPVLVHAKGCSVCTAAISSPIHDEVTIEVDKLCETGRAALKDEARALHASAKALWTPIVPRPYVPPKTWDAAP